MKSNNSAGRAFTTGNHVKLTTADAFSSGQISGLILTETSDGAILRMESSGEAFYLSQIFETEKPFNDLVASWKAPMRRFSHGSICRNTTAGQILPASYATDGATGFPGANGVLILPAAARISRMLIQGRTVKKITAGSMPTPVTAAVTALSMYGAA